MSHIGPRQRLLILSFSRIASDARVLKQVQLFSSEYDVITCGYGVAPDGVIEHIQVPDSLIAWRLDRLATMTRRFKRVYWSQEVVAWTQQNVTPGIADIILANDVETVPLALRLAPAHGVHVDLHEYAPRQKEDVRRWKMFVAPYQRWLCRKYVARASSWTTVGEGLAAEYKREFGIDARVVTNAAPYQELSPSTTSWPPRLVHSGGAMPSRHLELMIDAVAESDRGATLDMYLVPSTPSYVAELKERVATCAPDRIRILDPLPYRDLHAALSQYDVGVYSAPPVSFNHLWMLPNKLFDFIQSRLAVVVSPNPEMRRIVEEYGVGTVAAGYTANDLRLALDGLTAESIDIAKQAADESAHRLSAEVQSSAWADAIHALAAAPAKARCP